ncbi:putative tail fiber protein [Escherichia phage SUSP2]|uniref:Tail fiber protein n=1 Tax=Escherichia phage SUSP2 TaxID=1718669 RepID=A0A0N7GFN8_9CAUD|nr:tail fiber protein [Escherichia phage SUSP2]ALH47186.1 putative tail fiber protein [Escherichia phage SUSP2]
MAEFKLSELNSINEIRSDDLLHVRVKKRTEMLGDEDRRMTYADFLASFRLERFLQLVGGTMTGNLGIVKLTYGGKDLLDPTGSSEIVFGDTAKTFKLNANGLKLTIADASRSATVYHTLNKPSPNELGMRTNDENDARFAIKGTQNTFTASQIFQTDNAGLTLKNTAAAALYYEGRDTANVVRFTIGNLSSGSDVTIANTRQNTNIVLGTGSVGINKQLQVTGQVVPSDFANFDARFYTRDAADQRFVQLAAANTITGNNTFRGTTTLLGDGARLTLKNLTSGKALYIEGQNTDASMKWAVGNYADGSNSVVLTNISNDTYVLLDNMVRVNKSLAITGQVQPSDWTNIDSRYVLIGSYANLAKKNEANTFTLQQNIQSDGEALRVYSKAQNNASYIVGKNTDNTNKWYIGCGTNGSGIASFHNYLTGARIDLSDEVLLSKSLQITGQVKPSDWGNLDARYFTQTAANSRFMLAGSSGNATEQNGGDGVAWNAKTGLYNVTFSTGGSTQLVYHMYQGASSTPSAQLKFNYKNGGMWYRSARDSYGFEAAWSKVYTEAQKPTPSEIGAYTKAETDQKIAAAVTNSTDLKKVYPVGIVTWFATNQNPNTTLAGMTWTYLNEGVGRTVRIGAANGSDVKSVGGADTVTLSVGHIPSHTHSFSATTSSFDYGTKTSNTTGAHTHSVSGSAASAGNHNHSISWIGQNSTHYSGGGGGKVGVGPGYTDAGGAHTHTISGTAASAGNHAHTVGIGAHTHTVSGNTGGTGSGSAFSVVNLFIRLMAWVRTA